MTETTDTEARAFEEIVRALRFECSSPHTSAEIAEHLGLSRAYVSAIERRALDKLARAARRAGLDKDWMRKET